MIAYACILCRLLVSAREQPQQVYASEAGDAASSSYEVDEFVKVKDNSGSKLDHPFVQSDDFRNDTTACPA